MGVLKYMGKMGMLGGKTHFNFSENISTHFVMGGDFPLTLGLKINISMHVDNFS